ncbi:Gfo/Idh/MocA family protein [Mycolicibacterium goodii]|uniref:Gfo/Idh/MocA family protein n=1 Tax=Mycolicibacterium goodii TaxID=134601 RepID=UPI001BDC3713|nr:Gfo/Idh/MocA family oxidoreductase [Mycolicibacterium goodii]MBU8828963.1 Gfo/Idh/MocA family oxidoreductase [Mycolicibacterium goodii]
MVQHPLRIGVIGAGVMGTKHAEYIAREQDATVVGVADPYTQTLAKRLGVPHYDNYRDLLCAPGIDAVIIANPNSAHVEATLAAIEAGVPALLEKPVAVSAADAAGLAAAVHASSGVVLVGHHRRHHPAVAKARELIAGGAIGRLVAVNGMWLTKKSDDYFDQQWRREPGGGVMLINLVHELDLARYLCGEVATIQAVSSTALRGFEVEDTAAVIVSFTNGAIGTFVLSDAAVAPWGWDQATQDDHQFPFVPDAPPWSIAGTAGSLSFPQLQQFYHDGESNWYQPLSRRYAATDTGDSYTRQLKHFISVARGEAAPLVTVEDAAVSLALVEAARQAAENGQKIECSSAATE